MVGSALTVPRTRVLRDPHGKSAWASPKIAPWPPTRIRPRACLGMVVTTDAIAASSSGRGRLTVRHERLAQLLSRAGSRPPPSTMGRAAAACRPRASGPHPERRSRCGRIRHTRADRWRGKPSSRPVLVRLAPTTDGRNHRPAPRYEVAHVCQSALVHGCSFAGCDRCHLPPRGQSQHPRGRWPVGSVIASAGRCRAPSKNNVPRLRELESVDPARPG